MYWVSHFLVPATVALVQYVCRYTKFRLLLPVCCWLLYFFVQRSVYISWPLTVLTKVWQYVISFGSCLAVLVISLLWDKYLAFLPNILNMNERTITSNGSIIDVYQFPQIFGIITLKQNTRLCFRCVLYCAFVCVQ